MPVCCRGAQVDQSQPYGILITNGEFTAFCDAPSHTFCPGPSWPGTAGDGTGTASGTAGQRQGVGGRRGAFPELRGLQRQRQRAGGATTQRDPVHVRIGPNNQGAVKFATSAFWGPASQIAVTEGVGTISFTQCHFDSWDHHVSLDGKGYTIDLEKKR